MERITQHSTGEQPNQKREQAGHTNIFEVAGESYEEVSFVHEPMERYKDDIVRLNLVIEQQKQALHDAEEKAVVGADMDVFATHAQGVVLEDRILYMKNELERFEAIRRETLQRLGQLARQDQREKDLLDDCSTTVEH